uniref:ER membrane protein complex subunit 3 n=1 Tax=Panagrellus redivivus TaxID=6233 RepID=A0A7E4VUD7_PANRE
MSERTPNISPIMTDLLLDPAIRTWVFIPIVVVTFFAGIVRHYVHLLLQTKKKGELVKLQDTHYLAKARLLRMNGGVLPRADFEMRKHFLTNEKEGYLQQKMQAPSNQANMMTDPSMMTEMLKGNMLNMIPMVVIGGWINWTFSGFVTTKVPFPLTLRFKPMLQRGVNLSSLNAAWVSSASWYFLNVFSLRSIYALVLGDDNAAGTTMDEQLAGVNPAVQQDPKQVFKAEWEALQISFHKFKL